MEGAGKDPPVLQRDKKAQCLMGLNEFSSLTAAQTWFPYSRNDRWTCLRPCSKEDFIAYNISIASIFREGLIFSMNITIKQI